MITQDLLKKIEKTNKELDKIRAKGNVPITNHSFYQETYNRVLKPVGTKGSGRIMSYSEANKRYQKYFPGETLSEETYTEDVESLLFTGGERLTEKGEEEYQRERMESTIEDARNYNALPFDFCKLSLLRLRGDFLSEVVVTLLQALALDEVGELDDLDLAAQVLHGIENILGVLDGQEAVGQEGGVDGLGHHAQQVDLLVGEDGDHVEQRVLDMAPEDVARHELGGGHPGRSPGPSRPGPARRGSRFLRRGRSQRRGPDPSGTWAGRPAGRTAR